MTNTIDFGMYTSLEWDKLSTEYLHGLADMGNIEAQNRLQSIYKTPIEKQKIGFGKFSGQKCIDLDVDYLYWILNNVDTVNIKYKLAIRALEYIKKHINNDDFIDVIYVD